jgi:hypothetical protein
MPKLTDETTHLTIDGKLYPKNWARVDIRGNAVGVIEVGTNNIAWTGTVIFSDWTDGSDTPFATLGDLLTALSTALYA